MTPDPISRVRNFSKIKEYDKMISIEPIMNFDLDNLVEWVKEIKPKFVSIGADSKGHKLPEPSKEKVNSLIKELKEFTEVKVKDNLRRIKNDKSNILARICLWGNRNIPIYYFG